MNNFKKQNLNYIEWLQERNKSFTTINTYCQFLEQYLTNNAISTENIRSFLKENITKYQPGSLKLFRYSLASFAKFQKITVDWEWIKGIIPKTQRKCFDILSLEELKQLKATKSERNKVTYQRNNLIFDFLFFFGGFRLSELVNIRHNDWDAKNESLKVHGKGNKVRYIFLPPQLIKHFKVSSNDYLFTNLKQKKLCSLVIRQIISQRLKTSGINKNITPHSFRRSFATLLHKRKAKLTTIQFLLGHESITTTEKYIQFDRNTMFTDYSKLWTNNSLNY